MLELKKIATGVCLVVASALANAAANPSDVEQVVKSVQRAYPDLRVLCNGGADVVRNAVIEVMRSPSATIRKDSQGVTEAAVQRILATCTGRTP